MNRYYPWLLATFSAILLFCSFPNLNLFPLAWISIVPLLVALKHAKNWKSAFGIGYLTGFLFFGGLLFAILLLYPYASIYATLLGYLLLVGYTALYFAAFSTLVSLLPWRSGVWFPLSVACIWAALEWVRSWLLTGFAWGSVGYSQWNNLPGIQVASIIGVYGISFVVVLFNAGIAMLIRERHQWRKQLRAMVLPLILTLICFAYGFFHLRSVDNVDNVSEKDLKIALVPGNISQLRKWNINEFPSILRRYITLTQQATRDAPDVVVWPETAVRGEVLSGKWPTYSNRLKQMLRDAGLPLLIGATYEDVDNPDEKQSVPLYNSVFLLSSEGNVINRYAKMHLVPFGEYIPLVAFLPDFIQLPNFILFKPFEHGKTVNLLRLSNVKRDSKIASRDEPLEIGVSICFESSFPAHFRQFVKKGAHVMGILTNDAWFDGTAFPELHLAMAPFRAVENRITVFRCANGGISCIVDKFGRIITPLVTPSTEQEFLVSRAPVLLESEQTLYTRYGDWFPILCVLICLGGSAALFVLKYRDSRKA